MFLLPILLAIAAGGAFVETRRKVKLGGLPGKQAAALRRIAAAGKIQAIRETVKPGPTAPPTSKDDPRLAQALALVEERARKRFDGLTAEAKKKGAAAVNSAIAAELGVDPGLTGNESWDEASRKVGGALGAAGAVAACSAVGVPGVLCGPVGAKLGAMLGGYLGDKLEDEVADALEAVGEAVKDAVTYVGGKVGDAAGAVVGGIRKLF